MRQTSIETLTFLAIFTASLAGQDLPPLKALIIDGQNNHSNWPETSVMMQSYLQQTKLFSVEIARTATQGTDESFHPVFKDFDLVVSNYNGAAWPETTQKEFVNYIQDGGGLVVVHAADNAFPDWPEYNRVIGLGGWGGRSAASGPMVYYDSTGKIVRDSSPRPGGNHGAQHSFAITIRNADHPITQGMPGQWLHANDELYDSLRGPAEEMEVLATAFSSANQGGSDRHEPMLFVIQLGQGRVFHTPMGHGNDSQECVGFIISFQRGCEWSATGRVTQSIPADFPTAEKISSRKFEPASNPEN